MKRKLQPMWAILFTDHWFVVAEKHGQESPPYINFDVCSQQLPWFIERVRTCISEVEDHFEKNPPAKKE